MADDLILKVKLDNTDVASGLDKIEKKAKDVSSGATKGFEGLSSTLSTRLLPLAGALAGAFAAVKLVNFFKDSAKAAMEAEVATNALSASLAQIGKFSQQAVSRFEQYAGELQKTTGISDDLIKQNAALLVSIGGLSGDGLERGTKAALDLAKALQIDTGTAFDLVAKASTGATGALGRYGIKIDENIPKSEKWNKTLELIEKRFGGLAETNLNTLQGSLDNLNNSFNEIPEAIGGIFTQSPALRGFINEIAKGFYSIAESIVEMTKGKDVIGYILEVLIQVAAVINNFVLAPVELLVRSFIFGFRTIKLALDTLVVGLVGFTALLVEAVVIPIEKIISGVGSLISLVDKDLGNALKNGATNFRSFFTEPLNAELENAKRIQEDTFNKMSSDAESVFSFGATDSVNTWLANLKSAMAEAKNQVNDFKNNDPDDPASKVFEDIKSPLRALELAYEGLEKAQDQFRENAAKNFKDVGAAAFQSLGRGVGQAFAAFGQALASGEDAGKAFLQSMLGLFADIAIQLGTSFILQGIAHSLNPFTPGAGGPLIGAGAALATFGGVLKGLSGGKSQTSASATGGGITASPSQSTELTQPEDLERAKPTKSLEVTIQGNVFDSQETGSRIVRLINEAFDQNGEVITQGIA